MENFHRSSPLYFVPAESSGEKSIDGRILLFSTALVNRFLGTYGSVDTSIFGAGKRKKNSFMPYLNGRLRKEGRTREPRFHARLSKGVRLDLLFRAKK